MSDTNPLFFVMFCTFMAIGGQCNQKSVHSFCPVPDSSLPYIISLPRACANCTQVGMPQSQPHSVQQLLLWLEISTAKTQSTSHRVLPRLYSMFTHTSHCVDAHFILGVLALYSVCTHPFLWVYLTLYSGFIDTLLLLYSDFSSLCTLAVFTIFSRFTHTLLQVYLYFAECLLTLYSGCTHNVLRV